MIGTAILLAAAGAPCAQHEPATAVGLLLAELRWVAAIEARDGSALACRLASSFADSNWQGNRISRDQVLAALPDRKPSKLTLTEMTTRLVGRVGIVRGVNTQTGETGQVIGRVRFTDIFIRANGGWRAIAAQETVIRAPR